MLAEEVTGQLPRLARLGRLEPHTRVSLGLLLDEQARRAPEAEFFLFEDRAYSHEAVKRRIDNVVRGLLSLGVRQGEHVGVLMSTRPSGLSVVAALNRLGAVAVLMRPDGAGRSARPSSAACRGSSPTPSSPRRAREAGAAEVLVLGGGGEERDLGRGVIDMERIDPDRVELPAWYRPNPGRAERPRASSSSPARASAPARTGSRTGAGRCRRSRPPRRRRSPTTTRSTR